LLTLLHGKKPHPSVETVTGVTIPEIEEMLQRMLGCNFGAIYVGLGIASSLENIAMRKLPSTWSRS